MTKQAHQAAPRRHGERTQAIWEALPTVRAQAVTQQELADTSGTTPNLVRNRLCTWNQAAPGTILRGDCREPSGTRTYYRRPGTRPPTAD